jgi:glycosyltransferase involved in cell wall biosynthesis
MRIGIVPSLDPASGGVHQYSMTVLKVLRDWAGEYAEPHQLVVFTWDPKTTAAKELISDGWRVVTPPRGIGPRVRKLFPKVGGGLATQSSDVSVAWRSSKNKRWVGRERVALMVYLLPLAMSFEVGVPYVLVVHDLQHRINPQFPEVSANGQAEEREFLFRNGIAGATRVVVDSETGKEDVLTFYGEFGADPDRIDVLPFLPPGYLLDAPSEQDLGRVCDDHGLPERYLFYPAQFWPHKNHKRLIEALGLLRDEGLSIALVLTGSSEGDIRGEVFEEVFSRAKVLGLESQVRHLGYVPNEDMAALYSAAVALVFPTFFGPTNIPVVEAWRMKCPVVTSDIRGIREQVGDAAELVDPESVRDLARGIKAVWTDDARRRQLVEAGEARLSLYTEADFRQRLRAVMEAASIAAE